MSNLERFKRFRGYTSVRNAQNWKAAFIHGFSSCKTPISNFCILFTPNTPFSNRLDKRPEKRFKGGYRGFLVRWRLYLFTYINKASFITWIIWINIH